MGIHSSGEDYLKAILVLQKEKAQFVPLMLLDIWECLSRVFAMQYPL